MTEPDKDRHGVDADPETLELDREPSVDGLLSSISKLLGNETSEGWGDINDAGKALQKQRQEAAQAFKAEANVFRDTFASDAGRKCLAIMLERTVRTQPYPPEAMLSIDAITPLVIAHNAQCNFVWSILQAIAQADNKEAKTRNFQP